MDDKKLIMQMAFARAKGLGPIRSRELLAHFGSVEAIFSQTEASLSHLVGKAVAAEIFSQKNAEFVAKELKFLQANGVQISFLGDKDYPFRLRECADAPILYFYKGNCSLNSPKMLAVVGTRHITDNGRQFTRHIIAELAQRHPDLVIVSGLAYGVDVEAHKAALDCGLATIGVMATGFDRLYPTAHRNVASQMKEQGGLLSEHFRGDPLVPGCFVSRNRIIAGMCDAVLVVESAVDGGALTTADIANSYNREVLAVPGRPSDVYSEGCNQLIKQNKAALATSADDVDYLLGWTSAKAPVSQSSTFPELNQPDLSEPEMTVIAEIRKQGPIDQSAIANLLSLSIPQVSSLLFNMEMRGLVHRIPGNLFAIGK
ncbi:MAG: DNA-processing protein DprA [Paludibacteraceae bacterium]|nr:DNA-processing protein DprA [Paludibacteraceae bacterium]